MSDEQIAREAAERIRGVLPASRIIWFGSRARGEGDADSDFDFLVVADTQLDFADRHLLVHRALRDLGIAKDVLVFGPEDYARYRQWRSSIVAEAERTGRILFAADGEDGSR